MERRSLGKGAGEAYLVGVNYWASHAAHRMWERWDAARVERDMALAASMGLNAVRAFFWTPQVNPFPGVVDEQVLERFGQFLEICRRHGIGVLPTLFVGHMSGTNWDIPWRQGRHFCADPYMVYWESEFVRHVVGRFRGHPAVLGWVLTNELPNYTGGMPPETATVWTRAMHQAVKEADPGALVGTGDGARCEVRPDYDGFRVEWIRDHVDWVGVHLYNYFWWEQGDFDDLRKSYHIPCRLRYVDVGKPVLLEEFGLSDLIAGPEEAAGYYRSVLYSAWVNGACGALAWCLTDFDLAEEVPYLFQPHELRFGVATADGRLKPQGEELAAFARFARERRIHRFQMAPPSEAILVPYYMYEDRPGHRIDRLRSYRLLEEAFTLAKMAGLNPDFVRDVERLSGYRLALLPGGFRLKSPEWERLEAWVAGGGTLYVSYVGTVGGIYAPNFERLFGCRHRLRYGQLEQPEEPTVTLRFQARLGGIEAGDELTLPRGPLGRESAYLPVEPAGAEVVAVDGRGRPALLRHRLGSGRVILSAYPVEFMLLNTPDANLQTEAHRLYRALAEEAGVRLRFAGACPQLELAALTSPEGEALLAVINHAHRPAQCTVQDTATGQELHLAMKAKEVRVFEAGRGGWRLILQRPAGGEGARAAG